MPLLDKARCRSTDGKQRRWLMVGGASGRTQQLGSSVVGRISASHESEAGKKFGRRRAPRQVSVRSRRRLITGKRALGGFSLQVFLVSSLEPHLARLRQRQTLPAVVDAQDPHAGQQQYDCKVTTKILTL